MQFKIRWNAKARDFLKSLPSDAAQRIVKKIKSIEENPFRYLGHVEIDKCYKLRIGIYRALIEVDYKKRILIVRVLDKRIRIYKR
jgi:mRNA-degrading endonuclease RelE of RelBE toxin-antitoxin system